MELILQPENSSTCGQCCVAMISGKTEADIISLMKTKGGTNTKHLREALRALNFDPGEKAERISAATVLPEICIVKLTYDWRKNKGHWVVYNNGEVFCPGWGRYPYSRHFQVFPTGCNWGRPTSFLRINK